jgi:hypothetical protein
MDPHDLRDLPWHRSARARVRSLFPWARVPLATLTGHCSQFDVYHDTDSPWTLIVRSDVEPHRPVDLYTVDTHPPHAVAVAVAQLAHDEIEAGHSLIHTA